MALRRTPPGTWRAASPKPRSGHLRGRQETSRSDRGNHTAMGAFVAGGGSRCGWRRAARGARPKQGPGIADWGAAPPETVARRGVRSGQSTWVWFGVGTRACRVPTCDPEHTAHAV